MPDNRSPVSRGGKHLDDHRKPRGNFQGLSPAARSRSKGTTGKGTTLSMGAFTKGQTGVPHLMSGRKPPTRHKRNTNSLAGFLRGRGGIK